MKKGEKILFGVVAFLVVITVINFTVLEAIRHKSDKPMYPILTHFVFSEDGKKGYALYQQAGCYTCHRAVGSGTSMGVSMDGLGSKHNADYFYRFLKDPEKTYGAKTLDHGEKPKDAAYVMSLPDADLRLMATFISELKAESGSSSAFEPPPGDSSFIDAMLDLWAPDGWRSQFKDIRVWMKSNSKEGEHEPATK